MYSQEVPNEMTKAGIDIHYEQASHLVSCNNSESETDLHYTFLIQILNSYEHLKIMFFHTFVSVKIIGRLFL